MKNTITILTVTILIPSDESMDLKATIKAWLLKTDYWIIITFFEFKRVYDLTFKRFKNVLSSSSGKHALMTLTTCYTTIKTELRTWNYFLASKIHF